MTFDFAGKTVIVIGGTGSFMERDHHRGRHLDKVALRPANFSDAEALLRRRNDPATRKASRNRSVVTGEEHLAWLVRTLGDPARRLYSGTASEQALSERCARRNEPSLRAFRRACSDETPRGAGWTNLLWRDRIDGPYDAAQS